MDEVLFRSSQKLENLQVQLSLVATQSKDIFQQYSELSKTAITQAWNSSYSNQFQNHLQTLWEYITDLGVKLKENICRHIALKQLYNDLRKVFWKKWSKREVCFLCAGFICGTIVGIIVTITFKKKGPNVRYMQAIQCTNYLGTESVNVVENAIAPNDCNCDEVIIAVKAASVQVIDAQISAGYGKTLRKILQTKFSQTVTLGRDCTGIITDIGSTVRRLEVGDEVWLSVPVWYQGTMSQNVIVPEFRISRKPKNIGFEAAASLPYAGILALKTLKDLQINQDNLEEKRILIIGGCTPIGCILIQILKSWGANITTTCTKRAMPVAKALGANDIISFPEETVLNEPQDNFKALIKNLELREKFDFIIVTKNTVDCTKLEAFSNSNVVSTVPPKLYSDSCSFLGIFFLKGAIFVKSIFEKIFGISSNSFDEAHMCYITLDEIFEMVENGTIQTVVDKVLQPQDIEIALNHIQSEDSIGSTVITFR